MLTISASALAARPPDAGNGGGGGGGGGTEPPDFGDLIILYRDEDGVPHLTGDDCQQPLPSATCDTMVCTLVDGVPTGVDVLPVDPATCAVTAECAACTEEVDFGRINVARAPASVFEAQLADVIVNLATADCLTLDPAGRLVANRVVVNPDTLLDEVLTSTIDSPLQNLAIYRQLMLTGTLGAPLPQGASTLDTAARGLGVASDKTGEVNKDVVAYLNSIMGLSDLATPTILDPKICIDIKQEVKGVVQLVEECFLDYGAYGYERLLNFGALPAPAYIPDTGPVEGYFEHLAVLNMGPPPSFHILQDSINTTVFAGLPGFTLGNIGGFAQAADDTRAVINFMHDWPIPDADFFATPVPCLASGDIAYDVSISEESGLQVPAQMVDGQEEGREFTVTVTHVGGDDPATGTVTVTAIPDAGGPIDGSPWVFPFVDLQPGTNDSWTTVFTIDLGQRTTINWTAIAAAPDDVNPTNNTVTATTSVKVTGGGGGGGKP